MLTGGVVLRAGKRLMAFLCIGLLVLTGCTVVPVKTDDSGGADDSLNGPLLAFQAEVPEGTSTQDRKDGFDASVDLLRQRLEAKGLSEASVLIDEDGVLKIRFPEGVELDELTDYLLATAELTFRDADGNVVLTGSAVESAMAKYGSLGSGGASQVYVELVFKEEFRSIFTDATKKAAALAAEGKNYIAIYLDEEMVSSPYVDAIYAATGITGDSCIVSFGSENDEALTARDFADLINIGRLPFAFHVVRLE